MKKNYARSSARKLVPAIAMFTASAVMLSTATYAWFSLNRNAQLTGLNITATTSGNMEISIGAIGTESANALLTDFNTAPSMDDMSWRNTIAFSNYYKTIEKLKPASSCNALSLFYADDEAVYAGGQAVESGSETKAVAGTDDDNGYATIEVKKSSEDSGLTNASTGEARYVDIPLWIRSASKTDLEINCDVVIESANMTGSATGDTLMNAVKVALIPTVNAAEEKAADANGTDINLGATEAAGTPIVYGLSSTNYTSGKAVSSEKTWPEALGDVSYQQITALSEAPSGNTAITSTGLTLTATTEENYSVIPCILRVWLEGENENCQDVYANQDWNISLYFTADDGTSNNPGA